MSDDGQTDRSVTETLLDLIAESVPPSDAELEALVTQAESGRYFPPDPSLPDWSVNDKNVWLTPPMAKLGHLCISNENSEDFSVSDGGQAQHFTLEQFRAALRHWHEFKDLIANEGKEALVGRRYEKAMPE